MSEKVFVIPPKRTRYLSEIAENNRQYDKGSKANKLRWPKSSTEF